MTDQEILNAVSELITPVARQIEVIGTQMQQMETQMQQVETRILEKVDSRIEQTETRILKEVDKRIEKSEVLLLDEMERYNRQYERRFATLEQRENQLKDIYRMVKNENDTINLFLKDHQNLDKLERRVTILERKTACLP